MGHTGSERVGRPPVKNEPSMPGPQRRGTGGTLRDKSLRSDDVRANSGPKTRTWDTRQKCEKTSHFEIPGLAEEVDAEAVVGFFVGEVEAGLLI
jgi:hypothetical protein